MANGGVIINSAAGSQQMDDGSMVILNHLDKGVSFMLKKVNIMVILVCIVIKILSFLNPLLIAHESKLPCPKWRVGDWWLVEVGRYPFHIAVRPEFIKWQYTKQKYAVESIANVEGYPAYKVAKIDFDYKGKEMQPREYYYFSMTDLSLFQIEMMHGTEAEPRWITYRRTAGFLCLDRTRFWPIFPLMGGQELKDYQKDPFEFRRANGSIQRLSETGEIQPLLDEPNIAVRIKVEELDWEGHKTSVFRVEFWDLKQNEPKWVSRWMHGIGWPVQEWGEYKWLRLIASSQRIPLEIPRPKVKGDRVVE